MTPVRELPFGDALLVGRLRVDAEGGWAGARRPRLLLEVHCPYCRFAHFHEWDPEAGKSDVAARVPAECGDGPLAGGHYWVGLDPRACEVNWRVLARHRDQLGRWRVAHEPSPRDRPRRARRPARA